MGRGGDACRIGTTYLSLLVISGALPSGGQARCFVSVPCLSDGPVAVGADMGLLSFRGWCESHCPPECGCWLRLCPCRFYGLGRVTIVTPGNVTTGNRPENLVNQWWCYVTTVTTLF